jgi:hypothetical protein
MKAEVKLVDRFRRIDLATLKLLRRYDTAIPVQGYQT